LNPASALYLGGNLQLSGGGSATETVTGTTIAAGSHNFYAASTTGTTGDTINLGAVVGFGGGSVLNVGTGVIVNTTTASGAVDATADGKTGFFGGYWVIGNGTTEDFATDLSAVTTGEKQVVAYPTAYYLPFTATSGGNGTNDFEYSGTSVTNNTVTTMYGLKINSGTNTTAGSITFGSTDLATGNFLYTGAANFALNGSPIVNQGAYYFQQYGTGSLTVNDTLYAGGTFLYSGGAVTSDATSSTGFLSKAGPGTLILTAANYYGGNTEVLGGTLQISSDANIGGISGDLTVTSSSTTSKTVTVTGVPGAVSLVGASFMGTTISAQSANSSGAVTLTLAANAPVTIVSTAPATYAYASDSVNVNALYLNGGTLETTASFLLGETYTDPTTGTVTNYRAVDVGDNGATFQVDGSTVLNVAGTVQPQVGTDSFYTVPVTKTGPGTLILSGNNTYGGGTTVSAGTLLANTPYVAGQSSTGQGSVTVANGATLGGSGVIAPNGVTTLANGQYAIGTIPGASVTIQSGGTLAPGGLQTAGSAANGNLTLVANSTTAPNVLDLLSGAKLDFTLGTGNTSSELVLQNNVAGEVVFNSNILYINDLTSGGLTGKYVLFAPTTANTTGSDYAGLTYGANNVITGGLTLDPTVVSTYGAANTYLYLDTTTGNIDIAVPEPKTFALVLLGVAFLFYQRRKLRNQS
jgi:autotransporter-associated beta strand protein